MAWDIYKWNRSTQVWDSEGTIIRPNDSLPNGLKTNMVSNKLVDGSIGYITPPTKAMRKSITFVWTAVDLPLINQIEGYMNNGDKIKIETHNASKIFIGKFIETDDDWLAGVEDEWNLQATFQQTE